MQDTPKQKEVKYAINKMLFAIYKRQIYLSKTHDDTKYGLDDVIIRDPVIHRLYNEIDNKLRLLTQYARKTRQHV